MDAKRFVLAARWVGVVICLAGIVAFYRLVLHVNPTTVALTLLLFILFLAARLGLRYAVVTSFAAGAAYNYFFLPPLGRFTISDPQNLIALVAFLVTSVVASRMSERIRRESADAIARQAELETLYRLSRALLETDKLLELTNSIPAAVALATDATAVVFYLLDGDRIYKSVGNMTAPVTVDQLREMSLGAGPAMAADGEECIVPLRAGVRPRGVLLLKGVALSNQSLEALGGLVSISLDRAQALELVTRGEAAKESERLRALMIDSITHELRTPLTSIKASVSTLLSADVSAEGARDLLIVIDEESDRLNRLVAQAVEMAQLDTQEVRMSFSPQSVADMIGAAVESNQAVLNGHEVTVTVPDGLPMVEADPAWMQKVLGNLLDNAAKYSHLGKPIFVSAETRPGFVAISVADRGAGIDPMDQSLIFDKFYRARSQRQIVSGTGMGLAICRAIIEAHGGTLSVTSQQGQGSVFTFTLRAH
ncbi:MAG TPA: ATP-binding protein [Acidobacteriaceae bacterium]|nr:ATP-binding protein [Acidobacteriaceae bacterium]